MKFMNSSAFVAIVLTVGFAATALPMERDDEDPTHAPVLSKEDKEEKDSILDDRSTFKKKLEALGQSHQLFIEKVHQEHDSKFENIINDTHKKFLRRFPNDPEGRAREMGWLIFTRNFLWYHREIDLKCLILDKNDNDYKTLIHYYGYTYIEQRENLGHILMLVEQKKDLCADLLCRDLSKNMQRWVKDVGDTLYKMGYRSKTEKESMEGNPLYKITYKNPNQN